eukprot:GILI01020773.1.p1 GENE.GILI01020773.1~~GILI01020773.1.p1  ORF type:complete len:224 (+),score=17.05 GILI01020773.1:50-721(+)
MRKAGGDSIDDLLDELSEAINDEPRVGSHSRSSSLTSLPKQNSAPRLKLSSASPDHIDDLLDELNDALALDPSPSSRSSFTSSSFSPATSLHTLSLPSSSSLSSSLSPCPPSPAGVRTKCMPPAIGGMSVSKGLTSGVRQRSCDRLRCTSCDFKVLCFENVQWSSEVEYMFFRNVFPDVNKLEKQLKSSEGYRAFACQCSWRSLDSTLLLNSDSSLKWVCSGH